MTIIQLMMYADQFRPKRNYDFTWILAEASVLSYENDLDWYLIAKEIRK